MSFLRSTMHLARRGQPIIRSSSLQSTPFSTRTRLLAGSSYGGGEGDPKGENPQQQGAQKSSDLEHPGPPPPDVGKGTGGGPTKATGVGHKGPGDEVSKESRQNSSSGKSASSGSSGSGDGSPKINPPENPSERTENPDDVEKHNEEFQSRHDRSSNQAGDGEKVDKKFWSGIGGADRQS